MTHHTECQSLLDTLPRVTLVIGKGGVGRTTVSAALGRSFAQRGERTLLCEVGGDEVVSSWYGLEPSGYLGQELFPGLFVMALKPQDALAEYLMRQVRLKLIYRMLFGNRPMRAFLDAVLGLSDLITLGKVADLERSTRPRAVDGQAELAWDRIIVDMPATGHALSMLRAPASMADLAIAGPLHANALWVRDLIEDPSRCALVLATWAEELPVTEAIETVQQLQADGGPVPHTIVLSGVTDPSVSTEFQPFLDKLVAEGSAGLAQAARALTRDVQRASRVETLHQLLVSAAPQANLFEVPLLDQLPDPDARIDAVSDILCTQSQQRAGAQQ